MSLIVLAAPDGLFEQGMGEAPLDPDDHRLFVLVADDDPLENSFRHVS
jgi:hypothetical protein